MNIEKCPQSNLAESKVPQITLDFWVLKILATTLGETGGDWVSMSLKLGYSISSALFAFAFIVLVIAQVGSPRLRPSLYWATIVATTTLGTTTADFLDRAIGLGYPGGVGIVSVLLLASFAIWYRVEHTVAITRVTSPRVEWFYWLTIVLSQTQGTALGDWVAASDLGGLGLGYEYGTLIFWAALAIVAVCHYRTRLSATLLFWGAFVLTRPLGATLGDFLDKPITQGGLEISRLHASLILFALLAVGVLVLPQRPAQAPD